MMRTVTRFSMAACLFTAVSCGGDKGSPTTPTPPATQTQTRIITISGDLSFGDLLIGTSASRPITIRNTGTGTLTVTGMTVPSGGAFGATWTSGQIPAGGSQDVSIRFSPTEARSYVGTLTVNGDQTSGLNTAPINARGVTEIFRRSGSGDTVFDMPTTVSRVKIVGDYSGGGQNFIVYVGGRLLVNEIIGTRWPSTHFEGTYLTSGGVTQVTGSNGVVWSFEEVR